MTTTTPEITEMRQKVLDQILAHPEQHNQGSFGDQTDCGTSMCVAGWACELDPNTKLRWYSDGELETTVTVGGREVDIETRAEELLGLDELESYSLFFDMNNDSALRRLKHLADTGELSPKENS